uniref:SDR family NAD(P)-dependent oxidoreductase n=1 Tax=Sphingomonas sp. TaxID=28214 RepID=UPI00325F982B
MTNDRLEGKVAIISGAARGQGANEARRFISEGARVVLTDIDEKGQAVAGELGANARFVRHDVGNEDVWAKVVAVTEEAFGKIDILVNNAGVFTPANIVDTTLAAFDLHYRVNTLGVFLGMRAVIPAMESGGGGSIINISSIAGMRGW